MEHIRPRGRPPDVHVRAPVSREALKVSNAVRHIRGERIRLGAFGESPEDALARCVRLEAMDFPALEALAPTDVVVEVGSAGVALIDAMMLSGQYHHKPPLPFTPGMEYSGVVCWTGAAVDPRRLAVGDRVFNDYPLAGPGRAARARTRPKVAGHRMPWRRWRRCTERPR